MEKGNSMAWNCFSEEEYEQKMKNEAEPYLQSCKMDGMLNGLYYEFYLQEDAKGTIVISYGFTESCEKYHELAYYMHREGYQVAILDHRGHGRSLRETPNDRIVHVEHFSDYVEDLHRFVEAVVLPQTKGQPLFLYAHSMGGCIAVMYLEQHPTVFAKAILNAPMLGINNGSIPDFAAKLLCRGAILMGKGKQRLFLMGDFDPEEPYETCACDSRARHEYYLKLRREHPEYQSSSASYRWALEAVNAGKCAIKASNVKKIQTPVLLFQASRDTVVRNKEQDLFLSRLKDGKKVVVDSRHEASRNEAAFLQKYLTQLFDFFRE